MSDFSDEMEKIWDAILSFLKVAYEWALPIFKASLALLLKGGGATLADAAEAAVKAAQAAGGSNDDKYQMAFDAIKQTIESEGKTALDSAINLAIEMSVAKLKTSLAQ